MKFRGSTNDLVSPTCIYCGFAGSQRFPREHVIPYAFVGAFQNALTLGCVCNECNAYFGRHLELRFASESIESIVRYRYGLRDEESAERTRTVRAKANVPGQLLGAKVQFRPDSTVASGIGIVYIPQVAFKNPQEEDWRWYTLPELTFEVLRKLEPGAEIRLFVTSPEEENVIRSRLKELGAGPTKQISRNPVPPKRDFNARVTCDFDFNMSRCVAKIAFNYLAYALEENTRLLLRHEFDAVRSYVRYGTNAGQPVVHFSKTPNLEQNRGASPSVDGHFIAVGWDSTNESLVCYLNLFNAMRYQIVLSREGLWFPLQSAHSFDFQTTEVRSVPVLTMPTTLSGSLSLG